jgi:DDE superfamily endonuclease
MSARRGSRGNHDWSWRLRRGGSVEVLRWFPFSGHADGHVLDILVQRRRDKKAAKKFFRKLLKELMYIPRVIVTDQLGSYEAAKREVIPSVDSANASPA